MDKRRLQRVSSLMKEELGSLIISDALKDPRIDKLVSITDIEITNDLSLAKIYISHYGNREKGLGVLEALNHAAGFIQKELAHRMKLRITPKCLFVYDESIERGFRISETLKNISK
ncbi:MAG: 30S ribosome-binding factor RbfA [Spirochaetales bacterium]|nr:30S ribosome-binding factor RbfA [Spirochaetales bacterium]